MDRGFAIIMYDTTSRYLEGYGVMINPKYAHKWMSLESGYAQLELKLGIF